ncbi:hypothetical protein HDF16_001167 [Granulicella aggregans]|uniref:Uncharacterized protein n=1 Tax=Granulicella aggregans TaxID=474949 RepID=A0A7W7ZB10_9BACT|nr:hypothetical protein [Granulicella aggregans]
MSDIYDPIRKQVLRLRPSLCYPSEQVRPPGTPGVARGFTRMTGHWSAKAKAAEMIGGLFVWDVES